MVLEELLQLYGDRSRTNITMADDQTIWRDRLRSSWRDRLRARPGVVDNSRNTTEAAVTKPGEPLRALANNADTSDPSDTPPPLKGAPLPAIRSKQSRLQSSSQRSGPQPQGIRKTRNTKRRQTRGLMGAEPATEYKQRLLHLLTPPQ
ncbi:MAG: hypothetical protein Q9163_003461 [Psora crenata]